MDRRDLLLQGAALAGLSACGINPPIRQNPGALPAVAVDIHAHIFNGRDLPIAGFIEQVLFEEALDPVAIARRPAMVRLITDTWTNTGKIALIEARELFDCVSLPVSIGAAAALKQDERNLATGIRFFAYRVGNAAAPNNPAEALALSQDQQLLSDLALLAGPHAVATDQVVPGSVDAEGIAAAVYGRQTTDNLLAFDVDQPAAPPDLNDSLLQLLRFAGMLTRDRTELLAELKRLYGKPGNANGISIFCPSLVDFSNWFRREDTADQGDDLREQMEVMTHLSLLDDEVLLLNYAPFCPLRMALEEDQGVDWFGVIQDAVRTKGYIGVKVYPPMGFLPWNNPGGTLFGGKPDKKVSGARLNDNLRRFYRWCEDEEVCIKSHANNTVAAQKCSGLNAAPDLWTEVLERYPNLRVNLAHFGGFEEDFGHSHGQDQLQGFRQGPSPDCAIPNPSFEDQAARMIAATRNGRPRYPNLYVDLSYWNEVTGNNRVNRDIFINKVNALAAQNPRLAQQTLYGSDWLMIAQDLHANVYLSDVKDAVANSALQPNLDGIMGANALRFLGLDDPNSQQRRRLNAFFPPEHIYHRLMATS